MNKIKEADILDKAKLTLEDAFKDELTLTDKSWTPNGDKGIDGYLLFNGVEFPFIVFTQATAGKVVKSVNKLPKEKNILFVLDYAKPEMIHFFKENKLFFVDTAGNCYVNLPNFKIFIQGRKNILGKLSDTKIAFQKTGLKLIYQLLIEPELMQETYRTIASQTGVSLASVSNILEELKDDKFIFETNSRKINLYKVGDLLHKWVISYGEVLRPKIHRGYFRSLTSDLEESIISNNSENEIYFGGEFGARHLNNNITAQKPVLYSNIRLSKMAKTYKIVPISQSQHENERIEVLEVFWNPEKLKGRNSNEKMKNIVDPILIYADLLISNDFRKIETAKNILLNEIRDKFRQYNLHW